jgi:hypothetical protein
MSRPEDNLVSDCCSAPVVTAGRTTRWFECTACHLPCDVELDENPSPAPESVNGAAPA